MGQTGDSINDLRHTY